MYHPRLRGTHYEMGYNCGALIYKHGFRLESLPKLSVEAMEFGKKSEKIVSEYFPEILEEMKGFSDGCRGSYDVLASFLLNIGIDEAQTPKCSAFAARNGSSFIFGRNHDYSREYRKSTESCLVSADSSYSFVGQADVFIGKCDGVNEKSLAIGSMFVAGTTVKPGINFEIANRYVLEKSATVREGVNALSEMELSTSQNFLLADQSGDMAVVEACSEKIQVRRPARGQYFIALTNNFIHPEMLDMEKDHDRNWFLSETRYETLSDVLTKCNGKTDMSIAQELLSGSHGFICQYDRKADIDTLWSFIVSLKDAEILRSEGNPSRTTFTADNRLSDVIKRRDNVKKDAECSA